MIIDILVRSTALYVTFSVAIIAALVKMSEKRPALAFSIVFVSNWTLMILGISSIVTIYYFYCYPTDVSLYYFLIPISIYFAIILGGWKLIVMSLFSYAISSEMDDLLRQIDNRD